MLTTSFNPIHSLRRWFMLRRPFTPPGSLTLNPLLPLDVLEYHVHTLLYRLIPTDIYHPQSTSKVTLLRLSGALTNCVYRITLTSPLQEPQRFLLRVYGAGSDGLFSREDEIAWMRKLSDLALVPRLLGVFKNGRIEAWIDSHGINAQDLRRSEVAEGIASRMGKLHRTVAKHHPSPSLPRNGDASDEAEAWWKFASRWYPGARVALLKAAAHDPRLGEYAKQAESASSTIALDALWELSKEYRAYTRQLASPVVFGHNDLQYGNILIVNTGNDNAPKHTRERVALIDLEYSGYTPQAFDIANHFCEFVADYHHETAPHVPHHPYPEKEERKRFLAAYLESYQEGEVSEATLETLDAQVQGFRAASHWMWALWGLLQTGREDIDFDYVGYACWRLEAFEQCAKEALARN